MPVGVDPGTVLGAVGERWPAWSQRGSRDEPLPHPRACRDAKWWSSDELRTLALAGYTVGDGLSLGSPQRSPKRPPASQLHRPAPFLEEMVQEHLPNGLESHAAPHRAKSAAEFVGAVQRACRHAVLPSASDEGASHSWAELMLAVATAHQINLSRAQLVTLCNRLCSVGLRTSWQSIDGRLRPAQPPSLPALLSLGSVLRYVDTCIQGVQLTEGGGAAVATG